MIEKYLEEPKPGYRSLAFWSLNGDLTEDELFRQLLEFKMGGFGGVFLHARGALRTPYLSNLWMEKMRYCMKTAGELGLEAWIYDENNWPSGRAEGAVEKLGGRNVSKKLSMLPAEEFPMAGEVARTSDGKFAFCVGYGEMTNQLSRRTTEDFIGIVYERYKKDCGEFFGNVCPGVFFDEPQYASAYDRNDYVPWADELPDVYSELWGEELRPELRCLFFGRGRLWARQKTVLVCGGGALRPLLGTAALSVVRGKRTEAHRALRVGRRPQKSDPLHLGRDAPLRV